jgi:hypothetical protein
VAIYTFSFLIAMPTSEKLASGVNDWPVCIPNIVNSMYIQ